VIVHRYSDPYNTDPTTGQPATVERYGIGIKTGRRLYGWMANGAPHLDGTGADGADTVTAVMFDTGKAETFDVSAVEVVPS
jgi:hypothetical protein